MTGEILIFFAEDDVDDQLIFYEAISEISKSIKITMFDNGEDLINRLKNVEPLPTIIFLDLLMPVRNGEDSLIEIRHNKRFDDVPVVVFSNVYDIDMISNLFELGANHYLRKPSSFKVLCTALTKIISSIRKNNLGGTSIINYAE